MQGLDGAVYAIGLLGNQPQDSADASRVRNLIDVNLTSAVSLLAPVANLLEKQGSGVILGISSVAGERGRQSNYGYGAAKAGLAIDQLCLRILRAAWRDRQTTWQMRA